MNIVGKHLPKNTARTFTALATLPGCSVALMAALPTAVDLKKFQEGQSRDYIIAQLGQPRSRANVTDSESCDSYELYTQGFDNYEQQTNDYIGFVLVDIFTVGIAEVFTTPMELFLATRAKSDSVAFCYNAGELVQLPLTVK